MMASAVISATFYVVWYTLGRKPHALSWSLGFLVATIHWGVNIAQPAFPGFESYWLTANSLAMIVIMLGLIGHYQRTQPRWMPGNLWPFAIVVFGAIAFVSLGLRHTGASIALMPFAAAVSLFLSAAMILVHRKHTRIAEWVAAIVIIIFGITQLTTGGVGMMQGAAGDPVYRDLFMSWNYLTLPAGYIGMAIAIILMVASDLSEDMKELAVRDNLTGLLNRRGFNELSARAYATALRTKRSVTVIASDIDHFKTINDDYGHTVGDLALVHLATLLAARRRKDDIVARMGGEEFLIILPGMSLEQGLAVADEMCERMATTPMRIAGGDVTMTASFGVAALSERDTCLSDVIIRADEALYRSKRAGRNRVDLDSSQYMRAMDGTLTAKG